MKGEKDHGYSYLPLLVLINFFCCHQNSCHKFPMGEYFFGHKETDIMEETFSRTKTGPISNGIY